MVKVARSVSGKKLKFKGKFNTCVTFDGKMYNSKEYIVPGNDLCLFGINWILLFDLWEMLINSYCNKLDATEKRNPDK